MLAESGVLKLPVSESRFYGHVPELSPTTQAETEHNEPFLAFDVARAQRSHLMSPPMGRSIVYASWIEHRLI